MGKRMEGGEEVSGGFSFDLVAREELFFRAVVADEMLVKVYPFEER